MKSNIKNRTIFLGDNLLFLPNINSECVDLICTDPPFNKKKEFTAPIGSSAEGASFLDLFAEEDVKDEWVDEIRQEHFELHSFLAGVKAMGNSYNYCYLVYMAMRILECHRVLKNTGSFYLHCDQTMSHYLKLLLDIIFGENNFRNEIIWHHPKIGVARSKFTANTDTIFFYVKTNDYPFSIPRADHPNELHARWRSKLRDNKLYYAQAKLINDSPAKSKIIVRQKELGRELNDNDVVVDFDAPENKKVLDNVWKIPFLKGNSKESTGWPTQKPLALYERIIQASSNKGDLVLDPFCGCATTCIAAERLERNWVGIDVAHESWKQIESRLKKEVPADLIRGKAVLLRDPPVRGKQDAQPKKYVYVISNKAFPGLYKVGIAANAEARLSQYQTSDPHRGYQLEFKYLTANYREIEKYIHTEFNGDYEWVSGELDAIIDAIKTYQSG